MKKEHYHSLESFKAKINPTSYMVSNEGCIYITDNFVYKIFYSSDLDSYYCQKSNITSISRLSEQMLTIPVSLIYINNKYMGFKMFNCGNNLNNLFLEGKLSKEELIAISIQLKEIEQYLRKKSLIHGDIQLSNLLYQNRNVTLTDINSFIKLPKWYNFYKKYFISTSGGQSLRIPGDYYFWVRSYGYEYLDYLAINYCTFLLLNYTPSEIDELNKRAHECKIYKKTERFIDDAENKAFEDDVFDYFVETFSGNKKKVLSDLYLIDHLK